MSYEALFEHGLTRIDPERAHHQAFLALRAGGPMLRRRGTGVDDPVTAMGITFPNKVGLAAGFDKNAVAPDALAGLGFGHVEVGTVTGEAQPGNPRPRLFRLPSDHAIINRMGFNNDGAVAVAQRLHNRQVRLRRSAGTGPVLGINIGKTKLVPEDQAVEDYHKSARLLAGFADYLVINVSSPNTPGLRDLQNVEKLAPIISAVRRAAQDASGRDVPLLVKIAPDLADADLVAVAELAKSTQLAGLIATNTTISRAGLTTPAHEVRGIGAGGLSGAPLKERANEVLKLLADEVGAGVSLIGAGGIATAADVHERLAAGATLVQGYSGLIYGGPRWPRRMALAARDGS